MSSDFRQSQVRTTKIIASGSHASLSIDTGYQPSLLIYSASHATNSSGGFPSSMLKNTSGTNTVGNDVWMFVSGSTPSAGVDNSMGTVLFVGDVKLSGSLYDKNGDEVTAAVSGWVDDGATVRLRTGADKVGIGTTAPETALHVQSNSAGTIATVDGALLTLESNEKPKLHFQSPNGYGGTIVFGSVADNDEGQIDYDHTSDRFLFKTGGNTQMSILGDKVGIGTSSPGTKLQVDGHVSIGGSNNELRFYEGANYVGFEAPALSGDKIWVLPPADGTAGQVIKTDGSGNLGWTDGGASSAEYSPAVRVSSDHAGTATDENRWVKIAEAQEAIGDNDSVCNQMMVTFSGVENVADRSAVSAFLVTVKYTGKSDGNSPYYDLDGTEITVDYMNSENLSNSYGDWDPSKDIYLTVGDTKIPQVWMKSPESHRWCWVAIMGGGNKEDPGEYTDKGFKAATANAFQATPQYLNNRVNAVFGMLPHKKYSNLTLADATQLGSETLSNGSNFATTWTASNGFAVSSGDMVYTHTGAASSFTQQLSNLAATPRASSLYQLTYEITAASLQGGTTAQLSNASFGSVNVPLILTVGHHTQYFRSRSTIADPAAFVVVANNLGSAGSTFTIGSMSLKQVTGGDLTAYGGIATSKIASTGDVAAIEIDPAGQITKIGQDSPSSGQFLKWDGSKVVWDSAAAGDMTGVDLTAGVGISIDSETNTTSGDYSATITCDLEGTEVSSTGENGTTKFLRTDGDGSCSWQVPPDTNTQLSSEQVEDIAGPLVAQGGTKTGIAVTYQDGTGDMDFVVDDLTVAGDSGSTGMTPGDTLTIAGGTNVTTAMSGDTLTITATDTNTTYSAMTTSALGLGKIRYTTGGTPAAEAQTTTASRTYGVTKNASNQLVVNVPWTPGGGGTPGGSDTQVQFNNSGAFAGSANLTFDSNALTVKNTSGPQLNLSQDATRGFTVQNSNNGSTDISLKNSGGNNAFVKTVLGGDLQIAPLVHTSPLQVSQAPGTDGVNSLLMYGLNTDWYMTDGDPAIPSSNSGVWSAAGTVVQVMYYTESGKGYGTNEYKTPAGKHILAVEKATSGDNNTATSKYLVYRKSINADCFINFKMTATSTADDTWIDPRTHAGNPATPQRTDDTIQVLWTTALPNNATATWTRLNLTMSKDGGTTWAAPAQSADRIASNPTPGQRDYTENEWNLVSAPIDISTLAGSPASIYVAILVENGTDAANGDFFLCDIEIVGNTNNEEGPALELTTRSEIIARKSMLNGQGFLKLQALDAYSEVFDSYGGGSNSSAPRIELWGTDGNYSAATNKWKISLNDDSSNQDELYFAYPKALGGHSHSIGHGWERVISLKPDLLTVHGKGATATQIGMFPNAGAGAGNQWKITANDTAGTGTLTIGNDKNSAGTDVPLLTVGGATSQAGSTLTTGILKLAGDQIEPSTGTSGIVFDTTNHVAQIKGKRIRVPFSGAASTSVYQSSNTYSMSLNEGQSSNMVATTSWNTNADANEFVYICPHDGYVESIELIASHQIRSGNSMTASVAGVFFKIMKCTVNTAGAYTTYSNFGTNIGMATSDGLFGSTHTSHKPYYGMRAQHNLGTTKTFSAGNLLALQFNVNGGSASYRVSQGNSANSDLTTDQMYISGYINMVVDETT